MLRMLQWLMTQRYFKIVQTFKQDNYIHNSWCHLWQQSTFTANDCSQCWPSHSEGYELLIVFIIFDEDWLQCTWITFFMLIIGCLVIYWCSSATQLRQKWRCGEISHSREGEFGHFRFHCILRHMGRSSCLMSHLSHRAASLHNITATWQKGLDWKQRANHNCWF